ncbi:MAG: hypothetical protein MHPSP_003030, partial [Paramarteilia canceri]
MFTLLNAGRLIGHSETIWRPIGPLSRVNSRHFVNAYTTLNKINLINNSSFKRSLKSKSP